MDINEIRRQKLRALAEREKGATRLSEKLGISPSYLSQMIGPTPTRGIGHKTARKVEAAYHFPHGWMDSHQYLRADGTPEPAYTLRDSMVAVEGFRNVTHATRTIKILNYVQAGSPREIVDPYEPGSGMETLSVDEALGRELGAFAYALIVEGNSMLEEFRPDDRIIIDPDVAPNPGDFVIAKLDAETTATFKKYRPRGSDKDGQEIFELVPLNPDFPTIVVNADNPGRVIGTMVEHRRRRRRT